MIGVKALDADKVLDVLFNWRAFHAMPLDTFAKNLKERVKKISQNDNVIVAQRIKQLLKFLQISSCLYSSFDLALYV